MQYQSTFHKGASIRSTGKCLTCRRMYFLRNPEGGLHRPVTDPHIGNVGNKCKVEGVSRGVPGNPSFLRLGVDL